MKPPNLLLPAAFDLHGSRLLWWMAMAAIAVLASSRLTAASPVTLTVSSSINPSIQGRVITITTVLSSATATGRVTFYDGSAVLGIAPVSSGQALLTTRIPDAGTHALKAYYGGDTNFAPVVSAIVSQAVNSLPEYGFKAVVPNTVSTPLLLADFNGDGIPDMATISGIVLGNGDGTFQPVLAYPGGLIAGNPFVAGIPANAFAAAGDFNGDGKVDLALNSRIGGGQFGKIVFLLGRGDGNFDLKSEFYCPDYAIEMAAGDLNNDGQIDLAIAIGNGITTLLGTGDGTFQSTAVLSLGSVYCLPPSYLPNNLQIADFDADGKDDLAFSTCKNAVAVALGNGDGTFHPPVLWRAGTQNVASLVSGDINHDGKLDIVSGGGSAINILLGNGDESFQAPVSYLRNYAVGAIVLADFDGDGNPDILENGSGSIVVLLGNGDGTFRPAAVPSTGSNGPLLTGDLNGDGMTDLVVASSSPRVLLGYQPSGLVPWVHIDAPAANTVLSGGVTLSGWALEGLSQAGANAISSVAVLVDEIQVGNANYNIARPDVCAALPGRPGCPNVGWSYNPNTTALAAGPHYLTVVATDTAGVVGSSTVAFTSPAVLPFVKVDSPLSGASLQGVVPLVGWAVEGLSQAGSNSIVSVAVLVDGSQAGFATTGLSRPDVCAALPGRPDCPNVGWTWNLDVTGLPAGAHTLTVIASDSAGNTATAQATFTSTPVLPYVKIESPAAGSTLTGSVAVSGWAIEGLSQAGSDLITSVTLLVDNVQVGAAYYGVQRPDVCSAFPRTPCPNPGWSYLLDLRGVAAGSHTLTVVATDSLGGKGSAPVAFTVPALTPTTLSLSTSGSPSTLGQPVTLTAAVSDSRASGFVTFYDGSTVLGTSPMAGGQATLTRRTLASGARQLKAYYFGSTSFAPGASGIRIQQVNALAVNGLQRWAPSPAPIQVLGASPVEADFNGDGTVDIAASDGRVINIFLAFGDGNFSLAVPSTLSPTPSYNSIQTLAAGDFNSDGLADLAVADGDTGLLYIFLAKGDGTLQPANVTPNFSCPNCFFGVPYLSIADFNGDGKADLAITFPGGKAVFIRLGNGDGTFQPPSSYPVPGEPAALQVEDFNGDGIADIALANSASYDISVLLGNGDGSFRTAINVPTGRTTTPDSLIVADWNSDGKPDMAVADAGGFVTILLGNGDGTFPFSNSFQTAAAGVAFVNPRIVAADFNGDGKPDLVAATAAFTAIFTGNGDGTFQNPITYPSTFNGLAGVADFNGDGRPDILFAGGILFASGTQTISFAPLPDVDIGTPPFPLAATASSTLAVSFTSDTPAVCSVMNGIVTLLQTGTCSVVAIQPGNSAVTAATPVARSFEVYIAPYVKIEVPAPGGTVVDFGSINGWAVEGITTPGPYQIASIAVYLDGAPFGSTPYLGYGLSRPDVCAALPARPGCPNVGWSSGLDSTSLSIGNHTLKILATDSAGHSGSSQVTFVFGIPLVHIDQVASGATLTVSGAHNTITGWALPGISAVASVSVQVDGTTVGTATYGLVRSDACTNLTNNCHNAGWTFNLDAASLGAGIHSLKVIATDTAGNSGSNQVALTASVAPFVHIESPAAATVLTSGATTMVSGWAVEGLNTAGANTISSVVVQIDGTVVGSAAYGALRTDVCALLQGRPGCPNVGWSYALNTGGLSKGLHALTVIANDSIGVAGSDTLSFSVGAFGVLPYVSLDTVPGPMKGSTNSIAGWAVEGVQEVGINAIATIALFVDGVQAGTAFYGDKAADVCIAFPGRPGCPNVGWHGNLDVTQMSVGQHTLKVVATDTAGLSASAQTTFIVTVPPFVFIDLPVTGATLSGTTNVSGWAIEGLSAAGTNAINDVEFYIDGTFWGSATYGDPRSDVCAAFAGRPGCPNVGWHLAIPSTLAPGTHTLKVVAYDGQITGSSQMTFQWLGIPPFVFIDAPLAGATLSGTTSIGGWAIEGLNVVGTNAITAIAVLVDGTQVGTAHYGDNRGDVCTAFPGRPGCPNVGWDYSLDVTGFSAGSHTLTIAATDAAGLSGSTQTTFTK